MKNQIALASIAFLLIACSAAPAGPQLDLTGLTPLPSPAARDVVPLRVAVAAVISPKGTVESYSQVLAYLEARMGRPIELVQRSTYAETNELLRAGLVDVAFVCTGAYIAGEREFDMALLAAPEVDGEPAYHSWLIVPSDSPAASMADLRGSVFAFTDPLSYSGRLYPTFLLTQMGEQPETFFLRTFFTYSHDAAIQAVADGLADGAAVDNLIYAHLLRRDPTLADRVRIIHKSPPFGIPPVVVGPHIRPQLRAILQDVFLSADNDAQGRAALDELGIDRFVLLDDSAYDSARELERLVGGPLGQASP